MNQKPPSFTFTIHTKPAEQQTSLSSSSAPSIQQPISKKTKPYIPPAMLHSDLSTLPCMCGIDYTTYIR